MHLYSTKGQIHRRWNNSLTLITTITTIIIIITNRKKLACSGNTKKKNIKLLITIFFWYKKYPSMYNIGSRTLNFNCTLKAGKSQRTGPKHHTEQCIMTDCLVVTFWNAPVFCMHAHAHSHTRPTALCPGLPGWASIIKGKSVWILLKQKTVRAVASAGPYASLHLAPDR